ncbi:DUF551 domain-containing protein [Salmonella enterica subsp. enterica serovar Rissen]|uniref:DUF551 domain-containing protein n=1 Tax=Salmonella enterica TaxID=28901 RepID=UPI002FFA7C17|nr:DUF551 domain-containing protein [Salmonella enterica subsp. enterica]EKR1158655.1 DUF551 domain-containing protein [Salmonella enterica]
MTITKERLLKIQHWRETYGADSNVMLPAEEAEELARIALASLEAEKGADPVVFTDERNLHHIARGRETSLIWGKQNQEVGDIPLYRHAQPVPVDKEFIPKNLDKALGVVGVALPESKEEFNFQIERWIQRLIDRVIRYADEFKEQPVPVVPDEWTIQDAVKFCRETGRQDAGSAMEAWNACRAAMLQGVEQPQNARQNIPENIPDGNSPAIPDDWVMVPKEPTQAMIKAWLSEVANWRGHVAGYKAALAAAPQHEVK